MDRTELYKGFEIRAYECEPQRWRAEIRKADRSTLEILVGDSGHRRSITEKEGQEEIEGNIKKWNARKVRLRPPAARKA